MAVTLGTWPSLEYFIIPYQLRNFLAELLRQGLEVAFDCALLFLMGHASLGFLPANLEESKSLLSWAREM